MKPIGGYFELELPIRDEHFMHSECVMVNSGRHALEYILLAKKEKIKKIWLPFYTCEVVLHPITRVGINYDFYSIDEFFEIKRMPGLSKWDYILVNNYFGIKDAYIAQMVEKFQNKIIIDNAQAWYAPAINGADTFYSPRKFFGIPDGGVASTKSVLNTLLEKDVSYTRCDHLLKRIDLDPSAGYNDFKAISNILHDEPLKSMSNLSREIMSSIDFEKVKKRRRENYLFLHETLGKSNQLTLPELNSFECPMIYPYMTNNRDLRQTLISHNIFVATYWPNVFQWCKSNTLEFELAQRIIPLPIDQRYGVEEMNVITDIIQNEN